MRVLVLQTVAQWTGVTEEQAYLEIPSTMDVRVEERNWLAGGGGALQDFVSYLKTRSAKELTNIEIWTINYL